MGLRKKSEEEFISQNFSFLDLVPVGVFILRKDYSVLFWNSCLERWTGVLRENILHQSVLDNFPILKQAKYASRIDSIFKGGPPVIFSSKFHEYLIPCPLGDGTFQTQQTMITSITDKDTNDIYALFTLQDLTDASKQISKFKTIKKELANKEVELNGMLNEVNRVNKELEQFAYVVSHDLRAPLRGITHLAEWIKEDLGDVMNESVEEHLVSLQERVSRMDKMIEGIFTYSKAISKNSEMKKVDLKLLLDEIVDELVVPSQFIIEYSEKLPIITSHRTKLKQVLSNLIGNSVKHHDKKNGHIIISVQENEEDFEFEIKDDGPGIAPMFHEKIFQLFNTMGDEPKKGSTGIGLAIVKKIITEFDGVISLDSEIGKGVSFKFTHRKY